MHLQTVKISFPDISLHPHYGHKLRGYFGNLFKEKSPLLHNHYESGELRYSYPLVQYKIIEGIPQLIGLGEGAELLIELFLKINRLELDDKVIIIYSKNIQNRIEDIGLTETLTEYNFKTLWMGLNQKNFNTYINLLPGQERTNYITKILIGNILSFYKGIGYTVTERIYVKPNLTETVSSFKNKKMTVFAGDFITNAMLPNYIGLGKSVSRGYGAVKKNNL